MINTLVWWQWGLLGANLALLLLNWWLLLRGRKLLRDVRYLHGQVGRILAAIDDARRVLPEAKETWFSPR